MPDDAQSGRSKGAVFLSYASQDSAPVRRICVSLRDAGIEVWFDQSELVGGDAWDQSIRKQISECALFIPVISAATQERREAYFRLEWKLAEERTHLMAEGTPFLLPVTIDETDERRAVVPKSFLAVQWTKLPRGEISGAFCLRVAKLLADSANPKRERADARHEAAAAPASARPAASGTTAWRWAAAVLLLCAAIGCVLLWPRASPVNSAQRTTATPTPAPSVLLEKSIAVLPFVNMSDNKENAYFADGIQEDILTGLALIGDMNVISRSSVMGYRDTTKPTQQVARELGVAYILEGSVQRSGNKVRVTGQLIDGRTGLHVWAQAYDRDLDDIFAIQAALSKEIAASLHSVMTPRDIARLDAKPTQSTEAYDLFLRGRATYGDNDAWSAIRARARVLFERAVALDPKFVRPWLELNWIYGEDQNENPTPGGAAKAQAALDTAVRLAPDSPDVLARLFHQADDRGEKEKAAELRKRLIKADPKAELGFQIGDAQDQDNVALVVSLMEKRRALDPRDWSNLEDLGKYYADIRKYDEAQAVFTAQLAVAPPSSWSLFRLAMVPFWARGETAEMEAFLSTLSPEALRTDSAAISVRADWAYTIGDAQGLVDLWKSSGTHWTFVVFKHTEDKIVVGMAYLAMGKPDLARPILEKDRDDQLVRIANDPKNLDALRHLARVEDMLGETAAANAADEKAATVDPSSTDFALDHIWSGGKAQREAAIGSIARGLRKKVPGVWGSNVHQLEHSLPTWPLHDDPSFLALVKDPKNNMPNF